MINGGCPDCKTNKKITHEEFINRANEKHKGKFTYSFKNENYVNCREKIICFCTEHKIYFEQTSSEHIDGNGGCPKCNPLRKRTTEEFIEEAKGIPIHKNKNYDYSLVIYEGSMKKVKIICPKRGHGIFEQTPHSHLEGSGCPKCNNSKGESLISYIFEKYKISYDPQHKYDDLLSPKGRKLRYDFYVESKNILIEYDGLQHYNLKAFKQMIKSKGSKLTQKEIKEKFNYMKKCDRIKTKYAIENGIRLIRIRKNQLEYLEDILKKEKII